MPDDVKKLIGEIEAIVRDRPYGPVAIGHRVYKNIDTILAALLAASQLPVTADGVWIVPGMEVWDIDETIVKAIPLRVVSVASDRVSYTDERYPNIPFACEPGLLASTREAALAARSAEGDVE